VARAVGGCVGVISLGRPLVGASLLAGPSFLTCRNYLGASAGAFFGVPDAARGADTSAADVFDVPAARRGRGGGAAWARRPRKFLTCQVEAPRWADALTDPAA